jgi:hypothetical protein
MWRREQGFPTNLKEMAMNFKQLKQIGLGRSSLTLAVLCISSGVAVYGQNHHSPLVITSTNDPSGNSVVVFKLHDGATPSLDKVEMMHTGGKGGASTNAGILQMKGDLGAVANYGSNTVSEFLRNDDAIAVINTIHLAPDCVSPDSVALTDDQLFVVGASCAESYAWPWGYRDGKVVSLTDPSAAQIVVGTDWAAVTMSSGSLLQLPLTREGGVLNGTSNPVPLPSDADSVPLGAAFWGDTLGFTPAHSPDSFAIVDKSGDLYPVVGPAPAFPVNAPCWVAKGPGNIWYTSNSPAHAISIFFSDSAGGIFYKSVALPGSPFDITVSEDRKWLAVVYTVGSEAYAAVFAIDGHGDLAPVATSSSIGVASFNGVAISE